MKIIIFILKSKEKNIKLFPDMFYIAVQHLLYHLKIYVSMIWACLFCSCVSFTNYQFTSDDLPSLDLIWSQMHLKMWSCGRCNVGMNDLSVLKQNLDLIAAARGGRSKYDSINGGQLGSRRQWWIPSSPRVIFPLVIAVAESQSKHISTKYSSR